jgi:hypothetical protein
MRFLTKRTTLPAALLAGGIIAEAVAIFAGTTVAEAGDQSFATASLQANAISDRQLAPWVEQRIQQWQVTSADRRFDAIGWAKDLCDAERLAKKHGRPIFLFTHDGRIAIGRC